MRRRDVAKEGIGGIEPYRVVAANRRDGAGVAELLRRAQRAGARRRRQESSDQTLRRCDKVKIAADNVIRANRSIGRCQIGNRLASIVTFCSVTPPALIRSCRCCIKLAERPKLFLA